MRRRGTGPKAKPKTVHLCDALRTTETITVTRCGEVTDRYVLPPWRDFIPDRYTNGSPVEKCKGCEAESDMFSVSAGAVRDPRSEASS